MRLFRSVLIGLGVLISLPAMTDECPNPWRCLVRAPLVDYSNVVIDPPAPFEIDSIKQIQYEIAKAQEYAQKKQDCKLEITGCVYQLSSAAGKPFLDADAVDACLDTYSKCKGVHACDQNGEVIPFQPDPPKTVNAQTPPPYIYGQMVCKKQLIVNSEGQQWYEYGIEAPTLCNPKSNPANGPLNFSFQFDDKYKANAALCEPTDPAQKGVTFYDLFPKSLNKHFTITTVGDLLEKTIAYCTATNHPCADKNIQLKKDLVSAGSYSGKDSLVAKACMVTLPHPGGVPFVAGALPGNPTNFPADSFIFQLEYGYKVAIKKIAVDNVDGYCGYKGCTIYKGPKPNLCTVTLSVE